MTSRAEWEYFIEQMKSADFPIHTDPEFNAAVQAHFNDLGLAGWEMMNVSVSPDNTVITGFFKRAKKGS